MTEDMMVTDLIRESKKVLGKEEVPGGKLFRVTEDGVFELHGKQRVVEAGVRNGDPLNLIFDALEVS